MRCDLLVTARFLLPSPHEPVIENGALAITGDEIVDIGTADELLLNHQPSQRLERPSGLIIPGLINCHTHIPMVLFRGLADDIPLKRWLEEYIFPREAKLTPEIIALGTELACAEMIRSGTTAFVDMYFHEDKMAETASKIGLRGWYGEGLLDFPSPSFPDGYQALEATIEMAEKWKNHPLVEIAVAPHTPYTCSRDLLLKAGEIAQNMDALLLIHLSETAWEVQEIKSRFGKTPTEYLYNLGVLTEKTLAIHGVHLTESDINILAATGSSLCHCPESNLKLGSGICPVPELLSAGVNLCIGTDGAASNNDLDLFGEMDFAAKLPKGIHHDPAVVWAEQILDMSTTAAARALGRQDIGRLAKGCKADLAILDLHRPGLTPCFNPVSQIVYTAKGADVSDLIVAGKILLERHELTTIDQERLIHEIHQVVKGLV